jgi:sec-independent protein translocase protein TatA
MSLGPWQLLLILAIVILLFGAGRIPRLMGDLAKGIRSFKAGMKDEEQQSDAEAQAQPRQIDADAASGSTNTTTTGSTTRQDETART